MWVTFADGKTRVIASGTYPAKAGSTGSIPNDRMRTSILCWSSTWRICQPWGSGPPHPCMLPIRDLQSTHMFHIQTGQRSHTQFLLNMVFLSVVTKPSVLWRCWLGGRKGIGPVKNRVVGYWRGYLSGVRCRLAYGPADATATHCLLLQ